MTPDAQSQGSGSGAGAGPCEQSSSEKDPFLSLLEQLAENEHSQGGPSELDFFLGESLEAPGERCQDELEVVDA